MADIVELRESLPLGQRVAEFTVEGETKDGWHVLATGTTIGHQRMVRFPRTELRAVRVTLARTRADAGGTISTLALYRAAE
jgi:alpha-L-fucosidase